MAKILVMSLGGSLIAPDNLDLNFLKKFRRLMLDYVKKGRKGSLWAESLVDDKSAGAKVK